MQVAPCQPNISIRTIENPIEANAAARVRSPAIRNIPAISSPALKRISAARCHNGRCHTARGSCRIVRLGDVLVR
jgi:hypothetical protein